MDCTGTDLQVCLRAGEKAHKMAATGEATWIAVGVAIGAALSWSKPKK